MQSSYTQLLDNKVIEAARQALDTEMVEFALAFVPKGQELEIIEAFEKTIKVRKHGPVSADLAERYFFDTILRAHRSSLRRATKQQRMVLSFDELDQIADDAIATGYPEELIESFRNILEEEIAARLRTISELEKDKNAGVEKGRNFATAMLAFKEWTFQLYEKAKSPMPEVSEEAYKPQEHSHSVQPG